MFYFYGMDMTHLTLLLPALLLALWAKVRVDSTFRKYSNQRSLRGMTGAKAAYEVLRANGVYNVNIQRVSGSLTDHYDPRENVIRLSESVFDSTSPAAIGVAAHEAGHAVQYATNYAPIKIRAAIVKATNVASMLSMPLILISFFLMGVELLFPYRELLYYVALVGVLAFGMSVVFQLVTLPTEFNASKRAMQAIADCRLLTEDEQQGAKKVLSAAALTYVAALAVSLAQFLRLLTIVNRRRN